MSKAEHLSKTHTLWKAVVETKRSERDAQLERYRYAGHHPDRDLSITDIADTQVLTKLILSGEVSAEDIVKAYIRK